MGHVTVGNGQSLPIATDIVQFLEAQDLQKNKINAIGADGTIKNQWHRQSLREVSQFVD
jgi:hypothetical protein